MGARFSILNAELRESLRYDVKPLRGPFARFVHSIASTLIRSSSPARQARGFGLLMRLHTGGFSTSVDRQIIAELRDATAREKRAESTGLWACYEHAIQTAVATFYANPDAKPSRFIGSRLLVVKAARPNERGVIVVDYSNVFLLLAGLFDLPAIAKRYTLVLEPSWAGSCAPEILLFSRLSQPVVVETTEPRDRDLITSLRTNLTVVPIAANWWVDPRSAPPTGAPRDIDVIMVASWADMKRHRRVFKVLADLRKRGRRLKVALVGYEYGRTKRDIEALADHYGIRDEVETFERISQEEVSSLLLRSKIHILWSRRECANRAVIEAMMADVPSIVRDGLTFGFKYPYINGQTGRWVQEDGLGEAIVEMIADRDRYAPRQWVLENMTCEKATAVLEDYLRTAATAAGEPWTEGLVVKTSTLDTQRYFDPSDREKFVADYEFLESTVLKRT